MEPIRYEQRKTKRFRITTLLLVLCFVFDSAIWPMPEIAVSAPRFNPDVFLPGLTEEIQIPESLGTITARHAAGAPLVIYIQDAHAQPEAQSKVREILEYLSRHYGLKRIFIEGGIGKLDPLLLKFFRDPGLNRKMGGLMAEEGVLGGPELFLLDRLLDGEPDSIQAYGVEDPVLYRENLLAYQSVLGQGRLAQAFLERLRLQILLPSSRIFKGRLRVFFREWSQDEETEGGWVRQLSRLEKFAKEALRLDLSDPREQVHWPQLVRVVKLKEFERKADPGRAQGDVKRLVSWLGERGLLEYQKGIECLGNPPLAGKKDGACPSSPRGFLEKFYDRTFPLGFRFKDYDAWALQAGAGVLENEIRPAELLRETEELRSRILNRLAAGKEERALVDLYQDYLLLKKLLSLELLGKDFDQVKAGRRSLAPRVLEKRLKALAPPGSLRDAGVGGDREGRLRNMETLFREAVNFYRKARKREGAMYRHLATRLREEGTGPSALVAGGFHAEGLKRRFQDGGIAYLEITPAVSRVEGKERYRDLMTFKEDLHTFRSHLRFFSRIQSLGAVTLSGVGKEAADHGAMGINSAAGRVLAERKRDFNPLRRAINHSAAFQRHGLRYLSEGPGEVLYLDGEPVEVGGKRVGVTRQGPRFFSAGRSARQGPGRSTGFSSVTNGRAELRSPIRWQDFSKDYEEFDRFQDLLLRSQQLAAGGKYPQFAMVRFHDLKSGQPPVQRMDQAPSLGTSPEEFLKQSLTALFGKLVLGLGPGQRVTPARMKKAEGYRYVLVKTPLSDSPSKRNPLPTLLVVILGPDPGKDIAELFRKKRGPARSEIRSLEEGEELYRKALGLRESFNYVRAVEAIRQLRVLFEGLAKPLVPPGDERTPGDEETLLEQKAAARNRKLLAPLFLAIEKEGRDFFEAVLNFALGLNSEEANGRLGERALERFDPQRRQAIRDQADLLRRAFQPVGPIGEGNLPSETELEVIQFLEPFGIQIDLGDGSYRVPGKLRQEAAKFREELESFRKTVVLARSGPIPVRTLYNPEDPRLQDESHPIWIQVRNFLQAYYAVRHYKALRASQDLSFEETLPTRQEVEAVLGAGPGEVERVEKEIGINPETGKSTLLRFPRDWPVKFLPDSSSDTLTQEEKEIISKKVIAEMLGLDLQVQIVKPISAEEEAGEDLEAALDFFREIRREAGDGWRLHYVFLEKDLWAPYTRVMTTLPPEGGAPGGYSIEEQRSFSAAYNILKNEEGVWRAYERLSRGQRISQEMFRALVTDDKNGFLNFLNRLHGFYEGHEYFQSVPFKSAVGQGVVLSPEERKTLGEAEVIRAAEGFVNSLRMLGDSLKTKRAAGAFLGGLMEYAVAHFAEPETTRLIHQFLERGRAFLGGLKTEWGKSLRESFDEAGRAIESFELEEAVLSGADGGKKLPRALGSHLKETDPAYHFVKELFLEGGIREETAGILAVIASRKELAAAGDPGNLEKEAAKLVKRSVAETRDLLYGKAQRDPAFASAVKILEDLLKGRGWAKGAGSDVKTTGALLQNALQEGHITNEERLEVEALVSDPEGFYWQRYRKAKDPDALLLRLSGIRDRLKYHYESLGSKIQDVLQSHEASNFLPSVENWPAASLSGLDNLAQWLTQSTGRLTEPRELAGFLHQKGYRWDAGQGLRQVVVRNLAEAVLDTLTQEKELRGTIDEEIRSVFGRQVTSSTEWETFLGLLDEQVRKQVKAEEAAAFLQRPLDLYLRERLGEFGIDPFGLALRRAYLALDELRDEISIRTLQEGIVRIFPEEGGSLESTRVSERLGKLNEAFPDLKMSIDRKAFPFAVKEEAVEALNALPPADRKNEHRLVQMYFSRLEQAGAPPTKDEFKEGLKRSEDGAGELLARFETTLAEVNTILMNAGYKPLRFAGQPFTLPMIGVAGAYYRHTVMKKQTSELFTWDPLIEILKIQRETKEEKKLALDLGSFEEHEEEADLIDKVNPGFYDAAELLWLEASERLEEIARAEQEKNRDYSEAEINRALREEFLVSLVDGDAAMGHVTAEDYLKWLEKEMGSKKLLTLVLQKSGLSEKDVKTVWAQLQSAEDAAYGDIQGIVRALEQNGVKADELAVIDSLERANIFMEGPSYVTNRTFFIVGGKDPRDEKAAELFWEKIHYAPAKTYEGFLGMITKNFGESIIGSSEEAVKREVMLRLRWKLKLGQIEWGILRTWREAGQKGGKKTGEIERAELLQGVRDLTGSSEELTPQRLEAGVAHLNEALKNLEPPIRITLRSEARSAERVFVTRYQTFQDWPGLLGEAALRLTGQKTAGEQIARFALVSMEAYEKGALHLKKLADAKSLGVSPSEFLRQALEASFDEQVLKLKSGQRRSRAAMRRAAEFEFALLEADLPEREGRRSGGTLLVVFLKKTDHRQFENRVDQDWDPQERRQRSELRSQTESEVSRTVDAEEAQANRQGLPDQAADRRLSEQAQANRQGLPDQAADRRPSEQAQALIQEAIRLEAERRFPEAEKALDRGMEQLKGLLEKARAQKGESPAGDSPEGLRIRAFGAALKKFGRRKEEIMAKSSIQGIERRRRQPAVVKKALLLALALPQAEPANPELLPQAAALFEAGPEEWREILENLQLIRGMLAGTLVPVNPEQLEVKRILEGLGVRRPEGKGPFQSTEETINQEGRNLGERISRTEAPAREEAALIEKLTTLSEAINLEKALGLLAQALAKWHLRSGRETPSRFVTSSEEELTAYYLEIIRTYRDLYGAELDLKRLPTLTGESLGRRQGLPAPGKGGEKRLRNLREGLNALGFGELELVKDILAARVDKSDFYQTFEALRETYFEDPKFTDARFGEKIGLSAPSAWTRRNSFNKMLELTTGIPTNGEKTAKGITFDLDPLTAQSHLGPKLRQLKFAEMRSEVRMPTQAGPSGDSRVETLHKQAVELYQQGKFKDSLSLLDQAIKALTDKLDLPRTSPIAEMAIRIKLARLKTWRLEVDSAREKAETEEKHRADEIQRKRQEEEKRETDLLKKGVVLALALGRERLSQDRHKGIRERALSAAREELETETGISNSEGQGALLETALAISGALDPDWIPDARTLKLIDRLRPYGLGFDEEEVQFSLTPGLQDQVDSLTRTLGIARRLEPLEKALQIALVLGKKNLFTMEGFELLDSALVRFEVPEDGARDILRLSRRIASFIEHEGAYFFLKEDIRLEGELRRFGLQWDDSKQIYAIPKSLEAEMLAAREDLGMEEKSFQGVVVTESVVAAGPERPAAKKKPEKDKPQDKLRTEEKSKQPDPEAQRIAQHYGLEPDLAEGILELDRELRAADTYYRQLVKDSHTIIRSVQRVVALALGAGLEDEEGIRHWGALERFWQSPKAAKELREEALRVVRAVMFIKNGGYRQAHKGVEELSISDLLRLRQLLRNGLDRVSDDRLHEELQGALKVLQEEDPSSETAGLTSGIKEILKSDLSQPSARTAPAKEKRFLQTRSLLSTFYLLRLLKVILETEPMGRAGRKSPDPYQDRFKRAWRWVSGGDPISLKKISALEAIFRQDRSELRASSRFPSPRQRELAQFVRSRLGLQQVRSFLGVAERTAWVFGEEAVQELGVAVTSRIPTWQSRLSADHFNVRDQRKAFSLFGRLRNHSTVLAPVVHLRHGLLIAERRRPAALPQIFDAMQTLIEINRHHAHRFVLVLDEREDVDFVQTELRNFLQVKYPENPGKRNQIFSQVRVVTGENRLIGNLIPRGAATVWVDWLGEEGGISTALARAERLRVHADRLQGGGWIPFDDENKGYGASLLQALELLLNGPDQSGLRPSPEGPYVQISRSSFSDFGRLFLAVQKIAVSA